MSRAEFKEFHNEVFNLPRDSFSNFNLLKIKSLAEYLHRIQNAFPPKGLSVGEIYKAIHYYLQSGKIQNPNSDFEGLFDLSLSSESEIFDHYVYRGREFRHWMELASLLELLDNIKLGSRQSKRTVSPFAEELFLCSKELILPLIRDKVLAINTLTNPGIGNLASYRLYRNLSFRPAMAMLKYLHQIRRLCTRFELAIFFGRPNYILNSEDEIVQEALELGAKFPLNQTEQIEYYFRLRGWVDNNNNIYSYKASQQPYFKFNSFFILMNGSELIYLKDNIITLSAYSSSLFGDTLKPEAIEIEKLLDEIEESGIESGLAERVTRNRAKLISDLIQNDEQFLFKINARASQKSGKKYISSTTSKMVRDELIREASKQKVGYVCQGCKQPTFPDKSGNNFVESHHIIGYNVEEEGPDVLQNLIVLCPNCHAKIHFARIDAVEEFYRKLREDNSITLVQFKEIHTNLKLLKEKHIKILLQKKIITVTEADELFSLISS